MTRKKASAAAAQPATEQSIDTASIAPIGAPDVAGDKPEGTVDIAAPTPPTALEMPTEGGSYIRDPETGRLTKQED